MSNKSFFRSEFLIVSILLSLLLIIFFKEPILSGKIAAPTNLLQRHPPFQGQHIDHHDTYNLMTIDPVIQFHPWFKFQRDEIRQGRLPLWNPWGSAGIPHLANGQSAIFFPLTSLFYIFDLPLAILLNHFLKLYLAGLFTYYYLRQIRLSGPAAFFGAVAYMFCGFQIVWLGWPNTNVSLFLPALFLWTEQATTHKQASIAYLLLAVTWALQFLSGHFQMSLIVAVATGFYFLFKLGTFYLTQRNFRLLLTHLLAFGGAGCLGLLMAAVQIIPFMEYLQQSEVLMVRQAFTQNPYALPWNYLLLLVVPNLYGNPRDGWSVANYNETNMGYVGAFTLILAIATSLTRTGQRRERHLRFFFLGLLLFSAALVYGLWPIFEGVTSLSLFKVMGVNRFLMVVAFALAVLAALGLEHLVQARKTFILQLAVGLLVVGLVLIGLIVKAPLAHVPPSYEAYVQTYVNLATFFVISGATIVTLRSINWLSFRVTAVLLILLLAGDLILMYGQRYETTTSPELFYPANPIVSYLQNHTDIERMAFTFSPQIPNFPPNLGMYYQLYDIRSYDAIGLRRYGELTRALAPVQWNWGWWDLTPQSSDRLLDLLNVKYFVTLENEYPGFQTEITQDRNSTSVGELTREYIVGQTFKAHHNYLAGIQLHMATFMRQNSEDIYLYLKTTPEADEILQTVKMNADQMADNKPVLFSFEPIPASANQSYYFYLESPTSVKGNAVSFWAIDEDIYPEGTIYIQNEAYPGDARFALVYANEPTLPRYQLVYIASEMKIYENIDQLPRSYIVYQAEVINEEAVLARLSDKEFDIRSQVILEDKAALWPEGSLATTANEPAPQVEIKDYQSSQVLIQTNSPQAGYLVLTDNDYPGWKAMVDGQPQPIYRANYTFRAIKMPAGSHQVRFIYDPLSFKIGLGLTALGWLGTLVLLVKIS